MVSTPATAGLQNRLKPWPVEEALALRTFADRVSVALSPDGEWIAYSLRSPGGSGSPADARYLAFTRTGVSTEVEGSELWITNTQSGVSRSVAGPRGTSWAGVWSPDGRYLAFYWDGDGSANLWVWARSTNELRRVSKAIVRTYFGFEGPRWTPDSTGVIAKVLPAGMTIEDLANSIALPADSERPTSGVDQPTVVVRTSPALQGRSGDERREPAPRQSFSNRDLSDLVRIDVATGALTPLASRLKIRTYWVSPDGKQVALTALTEQPGTFDLMVVPLHGGDRRFSVPNLRLDYGISVSWSPDSRYVAYITRDRSVDRAAGRAQAKGDVFVVSMSGGDTRILTSDPHPDFGDEQRAPIWDAKGEAIYALANDGVWKIPLSRGGCRRVSEKWTQTLLSVVSPQFQSGFWSPDGGSSMYVHTRDEESKEVGFYRLDLVTGKYKRLSQQAKSSDSFNRGFFTTDVSDSAGTVVYMVEDAASGEDLWIAGVDFDHPRRVSDINRSLTKYELGTARLIRWTSLDGRRMQGAMLLPAGFQEGRRYPLIVKVHGGVLGSDEVNEFDVEAQLFASRGYAILKPDALLRAGQPMRDLFSIVMAGVDRAIELGIADPDRLGVMGHSFGGYSTLALIVQTTRFKAAAMNAGFGNLTTTTPAFSPVQGPMSGTLWETRRQYIDNSPVFFLDKVETPLLIVHGSLDTAVPVWEGEEVFKHLRALGKQVVFAKYLGEHHFNWGGANQRDYLERVMSWFEEHLTNPKPACRLEPRFTGQ